MGDVIEIAPSSPLEAEREAVKSFGIRESRGRKQQAIEGPRGCMFYYVPLPIQVHCGVGCRRVAVLALCYPGSIVQGTVFYEEICGKKSCWRSCYLYDAWHHDGRGPTLSLERIR